MGTGLHTLRRFGREAARAGITLGRYEHLLPGSEAEAAELFDACLDGQCEAAEERDRAAAPTPA